MDSWFRAMENFEFITDRGKHFIVALKDNGQVVLSQEDRKAKRFMRVDELHFAHQGVAKSYLRGYDEVVPVMPPGFYTQIRQHGPIALVMQRLDLRL